MNGNENGRVFQIFTPLQVQIYVGVSNQCLCNFMHIVPSFLPFCSIGAHLLLTQEPASDLFRYVRCSISVFI